MMSTWYTWESKEKMKINAGHVCVLYFLQWVYTSSAEAKHLSTCAHTWMRTPLLLFSQCMPRECYIAFFKPNHNHLSLEGRREAFKNTTLLIPLLLLPSLEWWLAAQTLQFHCLGSSPDCTAYMMCDLI